MANFDLIEYQKRVIDDLTAENKALKEQIDELVLDGNKIVCELYNLKENHEKTQQLLSPLWNTYRKTVIPANMAKVRVIGVGMTRTGQITGNGRE